MRVQTESLSDWIVRHGAQRVMARLMNACFWRCLGRRQRGDEVRGKRRTGGRWGRGWREEGRRTKRTCELLMRARRLALSPNVNAHIYTQTEHTGIYIDCGYCYTLHQLCHHPSTLPHLVTIYNLILNLSCLFYCPFTSACILSHHLYYIPPIIPCT